MSRVPTEVMVAINEYSLFDSIWLLPRSSLKFLQNHKVNGAMNLTYWYINMFYPIRNFLVLLSLVHKKNMERY